MLGASLRRFAFSQLRLYQPHLDQHFGGDYDRALAQVNTLKRKYSLDDQGARRLFKINPAVFVANSPERTEIEDKVKFLNKMEETEPIAGVVNEILFEGRHLVKAMSKDDIVTFISTIRDLGFDEKSAGSFFGSSPSFVHLKFKQLYQEKLEILTDYLHLTPQESLELFVSQPFLLKGSTHNLRTSVVFLLGQRNAVLTKQAIIDLMRRIGEVFLMGGDQMGHLIRRFSRWGLDKEQLWSVLLEHPLLFLNHPAEIFPLKIRMFKQFKFIQDMGAKILTEYPSAFICSVRSLESKLLTARDRLKIKLDADNVEFLSHKFMANIRPRSELMIRARVPFTSHNINDFFRCSEDEFLRKTEIPADKLREQKMQYSITPELDFLQKKCLKGYPSEAKLYDYSKRYYPKEDLILKKE